MRERPIADYALSDSDSAAPAGTELLHRVWAWSVGDESTVTVDVRRLREKVENEPTAPRLIRTCGASATGSTPQPEQSGMQDGTQQATGSLALRGAARAVGAGEPVSTLRGRVAA
jgi:hypothetical protein